MSTAKKIDIQSLSQEERLNLLEDLWDSLPDRDQLDITDAQKSLLDKRLAAYKAAPEEGTSWDSVKDEMQEE